MLKSARKAGVRGSSRHVVVKDVFPAAIYGGKQEPVMISLHPVESGKAADMVGFFMMPNGKPSTAKEVSCQDVQFHPSAIVRLMSISLRK